MAPDCPQVNRQVDPEERFRLYIDESGDHVFNHLEEEGHRARRKGRILILDSKSTTCSRMLREKELCLYGEYRTKLQVPDIYNRLRCAKDTGEPYQNILDPPPGPSADEPAKLRRKSGKGKTAQAPLFDMEVENKDE